MKRLAFGLVAILLPFSFTACGTERPEPVDSDSGVAPEQVEDAFEVGLSEVYYIKYPDGTRCVIVDRDSGGAGVDCDWK